jgi:hypothetical protein
MAFRMQASVPELTDMSREPQSILDMYGAKPGDGSFASNCLLARRLAERGVRFIQLYHRDWDHHNNIPANMPLKVEEVDRATAALIQDLKQRGMLDDTLVIWGGEFGRTPMSQSGNGRDHHIKAFSYMLAGGGIEPGITWGATDELGYAAVENPGQRQRSARDHAPPARDQPPADDGQVPGNRCAADQCCRQCGEGDSGLSLRRTFTIRAALRTIGRH